MQILFLNAKQWLVVFSVFVISIATHLPNIQYPKEVVFDETHFGGFVTDYVNGICFFDIHPPLAKLLLYGVAKITGYDGSYNFSLYPQKYNSDFYIPLRLFPAICGSLVSPLMTASLMIQGCHSSAAFLAGFLFAIDFTSITQSRLILTDAILYFFVALTIFITAILTRKESWTLIVLQGLAGASCVSIKITGAGVLVYIAFIHFKRLFNTPNWFLVLCIRGFVIASIVVAELYLTVYIHLILMPNVGYGDQYMPTTFRKKPMLERITMLLIAMYNYNKNLGFDHPYQSRWYEWPIWHAQPTLLWSHGESALFFLNNPVPAFVSLLGFFLSFIAFPNIGFAIGYAISYIPFVFIKRCTWTYHYTISMIFGLLGFSQFLHRMPVKVRISLVIILTVLALTAFYIYHPWVYGLPLTRDQNEKRMIWAKQRKIWGFPPLNVKNLI